MGKVVTVLFFAFVALCGIGQVNADASDHRYREGDMVPFYVSEVGPYSNPRAFCQVAVAGLLPFGVLSIELDYIFASLWEYRTFSTNHIFFMVFIILLIVTAAVTVALTYFQLAAEDHEWWWRSFMYGGSAGAYGYAHCCYYYYARSGMSGFLQILFFFGCMACICYAFFLMLGTLGFRASVLFVRHLYGSINFE